MELAECLKARHSYRGKYSQEKVPREDLAAIMEAGLLGPSGMNRQSTKLIAIDDPSLVAAVKRSLDPLFAATAPAYICVLSKAIHTFRGNYYNTQDYAASIENMLLRIVDLGYQSCWYEGYVKDCPGVADRLSRLLGVPDEFGVVCLLPVGKAAEAAHGPRKKSFSEMAFFNGYGRG